MKVREAGQMVKEAGGKFLDDKAPRIGAALAFYTALSLSPLLLVIVAAAGMAFGEEAARGQIVGQIRDVVGEDAAVMIEQLVAKSAATTGKGLAALVGLVVLLVGASGVFSELRDALNTVWRVPGKEPTGGIWALIRGKLLSVSAVCGVIFLLIASLVVSAALSAVNDRVAGWMPGMTALAEVSNFLLSFALLTVLFALIFKFLPDTHLAWSDVWHGAAFTAVLFSVGKYLIGLYLGKAAVGSPYGAAGAFVVLLVWVYYSAQIMLFGAELTFAYARRFGSGVPGEARPESRPGGSPLVATA